MCLGFGYFVVWYVSGVPCFGWFGYLVILVILDLPILSLCFDLFWVFGQVL